MTYFAAKTSPVHSALDITDEWVEVSLLTYLWFKLIGIKVRHNKFEIGDNVEITDGIYMKLRGKIIDYDNKKYRISINNKGIIYCYIKGNHLKPLPTRNVDAFGI